MKRAHGAGRNGDAMRVMVAAGALAALVAAPAYGQGAGGGAAGNAAGGAAGQGEIRGDFDKPLEPLPAPGGGLRTTTTLRMSKTDGLGTTYGVVVENGVTTATINGQRVPNERVRERGGTVEILDPAGNVLETFNVGTLRGAMGGLEMDGLGMEGLEREAGRLRDEARRLERMRLRAFGGAEGGDRGGARMFQLVPGQDQAFPPVMLGLTMSPTADAGVVVDSVVPGLPAAVAGIEAGDVITAIDGQKVESPEALRKLLRTKQPGDAVELALTRGGAGNAGDAANPVNTTVKLTLAAFDGARLGVPMNEGLAAVRPFGAEAQQRLDEARRAVEGALARLKADPALQPQALRAEVEQMLNDALARMDEAKARTQDEVRRWVELWDERGGQRLLLGEGPDAVFEVPEMMQMLRRRGLAGEPGVGEGGGAGPGVGGGAAQAEALERMSQQMERLMDRLDAMEARLERAEKGQR
jgi:hypothetical protein